MKKIILLFSILFSISAFSQIKMIKSDEPTEVGSTNSVTLFKKDKKYTFNYQDVANANLNSWRSFYFFDLNRDFDGLYKVISDGFGSMPKNEITMELPNDIIGLNYGRNYGQVTVQFVHYIGKSEKYVGKTQYLTKKQIDKIFGRTGNPSTYTSNETSSVAAYNSNVSEANTASSSTSNATTSTPAKKPMKKAVTKKGKK